MRVSLLIDVSRYAKLRSMKLADHLKQARGLASALARALGISPVLISQWASGARQVPAEYCPDIERETGGAVTCEDLRPDVNWGYLRGDVGPAGADPDPDACRIVPVESA